MTQEEISLYLSTLSYNTELYEWSKKIKNGDKSVYDFVTSKDYDDVWKSAREDDPFFTEEDWTDLKNTITAKENKEYFQNLKIEDVTFDGKNDSGKIDGSEGKYMTVVDQNQNADGQTYVIVSGTTSQQWHDNADLWDSENTEMQKRADAYFDKHTRGRENVVAAGHSKGSNTAIYLGVTNGEKVEHVYAFDGPGIGPAFANAYAEEIEAARKAGKFTLVANQGDCVHALFNMLGQGIYGEIKYVANERSIAQMLRDGDLTAVARLHSPFSLYKKKDGKLVSSASRAVEEDPFITILGSFTDYASTAMSKEDFEYFSNAAMHLMDSKDCPEDFDLKDNMPSGFISRLLKHIKGYNDEYLQLSPDELVELVRLAMNLIPADIVAKGAAILPLLTLLPGGGSLSIGAALFYLSKEFQDMGEFEKTLKNKAENIKGKSVVRDFTDETRQKLKDLLAQLPEYVKRLEQSPIWAVVASFVPCFAGFIAVSDAVISHFLSIEDLNKQTAKRIDEIFDAVISYDTEFAKKITSKTETIQNTVALLETRSGATAGTAQAAIGAVAAGAAVAG